MKHRFSIAASLALIVSLFVVTGCDRPLYERIDALDSVAWESSKWISAVDAEVVPDTVKTHRSADGASWFVSTLKNEKRVVSAKWMTAGLGVYDLYVNGTRIGDEILKPGYTTPTKTKLSFTYDITGAFVTDDDAENTLSVQVTPGWWADKIVTAKKRGLEGKKCAFRGVLELTYSDGTKSLYGTNLTDWKAGIAGPVKHAGIFDGEEYDAREKMGWEVVEKLQTPEENTEFEGEIVPTNGAEVYFAQGTKR
jgi:alpha-L-rhamnosidase